MAGERYYVTVRSLEEFHTGDFLVHPVIGGWKVARDWQRGFEDELERHGAHRAVLAVIESLRAAQVRASDDGDGSVGLHATVGELLRDLEDQEVTLRPAVPQGG